MKTQALLNFVAAGLCMALGGVLILTEGSFYGAIVFLIGIALLIAFPQISLFLPYIVK